MMMKRDLSVLTLWIILLLLGILPPILIGIMHANSTASGIILFTLLIIPFVYKYATALRKIPSKVIFIFILFLIYIMMQHVFVGEWSQRSYQSLAVLLYVFTIAYLSAIWFKKLDIKILLQAIKILAWILAIIGFFNIFTDYRMAIFYTNSRAVFPFGEPSHYALFSGMFFLIYFVISDKLTVKISIILVTVLLAILLPNTTMLIYALLMTILLIRLNIQNTILFLVSLYIIFYIFSNISYFSQRIEITGDSTNISSLVYLQGLDYAKKALINTNGLGLGFQMMGTQAPSDITYMIMQRLGSLKGEGLNRHDGGFLAAKIVTEFGMFGIVLLIGYLYLFFKSFFYLRHYIKNIKYSQYDRNYKLAIVYAIFFSFSVEMFVRGTGYFSPGVFIFLTVFTYYIKYYNPNILKIVRY